MRLTVGLTLFLTGCTCSSPAVVPAPQPAALEQPPEAPRPVDHGEVLYEWHTRLPTGAFTGLRAFQDGAVEVGGTGPRGLAWAPLRQLGPTEQAAFAALRAGASVAGLPEVIPDPSAPPDERVTYNLTSATGSRKILVEGARRTRIPALEDLDRLLYGADGLPRRSWLTATTASGPKAVAVACNALSQRALRGVAMQLEGVDTPDAQAPSSPTILRVENVSLLRSDVLEVREDGSVVLLHDDGAPHVGHLDAGHLATLRSSIDHVPWADVAAFCEP